MNRLRLALLLALASFPAMAGRPLTTEDASVLDDRRCQLEAWVDRFRHASDAWFVPACNFGAGLEWQFGVAHSFERGESFTSQSYFQVKGLAKPLDADSRWGVGWVLGVTRDPLREAHRGWQDPYVIVPASLAVGEALVHANLGWLRDRGRRRDVAIWGAAIEVPGPMQLTWVAEAFGEGSGKPFLRAGARATLVPGVLDVDLTVVGRPGGGREERYISLGVFWQSGRMLP